MINPAITGYRLGEGRYFHLPLFALLPSFMLQLATRARFIQLQTRSALFRILSVTDRIKSNRIQVDNEVTSKCQLIDVNLTGVGLVFPKRTEWVGSDFERGPGDSASLVFLTALGEKC